MSAPELAPGQIVAGRYGIQSLLGRRGAMATYHAMTAPNRQVALKLYDPVVRSFTDVLQTLGRYQMTTAALASKLVAPIMEIGEDPTTGTFFTVTDLDANPSLASLVELCPLSIPETLTLTANLGRAVDLLHSHGIVHLALHPNNVFVGPAPQYEARILDFGSGVVRRALQGRDQLDAMAAWLAPEQVEDGQPWDARTDVFAAALITFFAATGRSFWRSCPKGAIDLAAWQRELEAARVPASQRAEEFSVAMSPAWDPIFARALAPSPSDRFSSVGEFAVALAHAQDGGTQAFAASAGAPAFADIPVPPAQMEAVLNAFEAGSRVDRGGDSATVSHGDAGGPSTTTASATVAVSDVPEALEEDQGRRPSRSRIAYAAVAAALLLAAGGTLAFFSAGKKAPSLTASNAIASTPGASPIVADPAPAPPPPPASVTQAAAPQELPAANHAPEPVPAPQEEPPALAPTAPAPPPLPRARAPAVRRPAAPARAPAKKPCGKFLKRCN